MHPWQFSSEEITRLWNFDTLSTASARLLVPECLSLRVLLQKKATGSSSVYPTQRGFFYNKIATAHFQFWRPLWAQLNPSRIGKPDRFSSPVISLGKVSLVKITCLWLIDQVIKSIEKSFLRFGFSSKELICRQSAGHPVNGRNCLNSSNLLV